MQSAAAALHLLLWEQYIVLLSRRAFALHLRLTEPSPQPAPRPPFSPNRPPQDK